MRYTTKFGPGLVAAVGLLALGGTPAWAQHHGHGYGAGFGTHGGSGGGWGGHGGGFGGHGGFGGGPGTATLQRDIGRLEGIIGGMTGYVPSGYQINHMSGAESKGYLQGMRFDQNFGLTGALQPQPYYPQAQPFYPQPQPYYPQAQPVYQPAQPQVVWNGYQWVQVP